MTTTRVHLGDLLLQANRSDHTQSYWLQEKTLLKSTILRAIHTARANAGILDQWAHERLHNIGLNSGAIQHDIMKYFQEEAITYQQTGFLPNWDSVENFLEQMAFKYKGCIESLLIKKGIILGYDQLETEGVSNEKKDGYGINELKRRRGRPPKSGPVGATLLRSEREQGKRTRSRREKLSPGSRTENEFGGNELFQARGRGRPKRGRTQVQEAFNPVSTDSNRGAGLWSGSGQTTTDSDLGSETQRPRVIV